MREWVKSVCWCPAAGQHLSRVMWWLGICWTFQEVLIKSDCRVRQGFEHVYIQLQISRWDVQTLRFYMDQLSVSCLRNEDMSAVACTYLQDVVSTGISVAKASAVPVVVLLVKPDRRTYTHYIISVWAVNSVIQRVECWGKVTVGIVGIPDTLDVMPHKWTYFAIHLLCYCWLFLSEECIISHFRSSM